jgi:peptidoglycan/LPS O-acetylase OafA/YrhL
LKARYFETFDALRFFAYLKVFLLHLPITAFPLFSFLRSNGGTGVIFFFVLSGFLISYIVFQEKEKTGKLNLPHFFIRRILRICPLYYLMLLFAYCTPYILELLHLPSSSEGYEPNWLLYSLFLGNYQSICLDMTPNVAPLGVMWSLCIEEHFYLLWGVLVYFVKLNNMPYFFAGGIIVANVARIIFFQAGVNTAEILTNLDFFIYGAIPAYLIVKFPGKLENSVLSFSKKAKILYTLLVVGIVVALPLIPDFVKDLLMPIVLGIAFAGLITLFIPEKSNFYISDKNGLSVMGRYTYGTYLFHSIWISFFVHIFSGLQLFLDIGIYAIMFICIVFFCTLGSAWFSYHFFETQFLRLKKNFY